MPPSVSIRSGTAEDLPAILDLVRELAIYEKEPDAVTATIDTYVDSFSKGHFETLVAEAEGNIVGMALYYRRFSTWRGPMLYLEDFVVSAKYRGRGIGTALFERVIQEGRDNGYILCMWQVLDWNEPAIHFYRKYPVDFSDKWMNVKLEL